MTTRFYAVHISTSGRKSIRWSKPCATPPEAQALAKQRLDAGEAVATFIVEAVGEQRRILPTWTRPISARALIEHYEALLEAIEE